MTHFKIDLLTPVVFDLDIQSSLSNNVYYLKDNITDFYSQETVFNSQKLGSSIYSHSYSFNEKLSIHKNAQKELTFSMYQKVWQNDSWIKNPFIDNLHVGSTLVLTTKDNNEHLFVIKDIKLKFSAINIEYSFTCQDSFSYQLTRQNDGYVLTNDPSTEDFIGAQTADFWIQQYIKPDCYISYEYVPLEQGLYLNNQRTTQIYDSSTVINDCQSIIKPPFLDTAFFETIPFSCSGSNANAALISLADELGLMINVFEQTTMLNGLWTLTKYFWLEPSKHSDFNGLYYSPYVNIQDFGLSLGGESLTTVLNVDSHTVNDETISLFPTVPGFFMNYFMSDEWKQSRYFPGMFKQLLANQYYIYENLATDTLQIGEWATKSYDSNQYVGFRLYTLGNSFIIPNWYSKFTCSWDDHITHYDTISSRSLIFYLYIEVLNTTSNEIVTYLLSPDMDIPSSLAGQSCQIWLVYKTIEQIEEPINFNIYLKWYRDVVEEEEVFASMADRCPWLENKLINFQYFLDQKILSPNEYQMLSNYINNNIRIINGELMAHSQAYYFALHKQTAEIANITNKLDMLGATCFSELVSPYAELGVVKNYDQFASAYQSIFQTFSSIQPTPLLNHKKLITSTFNQYFNAEQRFLKNIKNFVDYFNMINAFTTNPNACIVEDQLIILSNELADDWEERTFLSFSPQGFASIYETVDTGIKQFKSDVVDNIDHPIEPLVNFYKNINGVYENVPIASPQSILQEEIYVTHSFEGRILNTTEPYNRNLSYFILKDLYQNYIFDYEEAYSNQQITLVVYQNYLVREVVHDSKTWIRLTELDLTKLYLADHPNEYYIRDTSRYIPFDWIRYTNSGLEEGETCGALRGINPNFIPTASLENNSSENNSSEKDTSLVWESYRFYFPLTNLYYCGPKFRVSTNSYNQIEINRINERNWTFLEYDSKEKSEQQTVSSPNEYVCFQPITFIGGLMEPPVSSMSQEEYKVLWENFWTNFPYFSFVCSAAEGKYDKDTVIWDSNRGLMPRYNFTFSGDTTGQWIQSYFACNYFTPEDFEAPSWIYPQITDNTNVSFYDSAKALYCQTACDAEQSYRYTQAWNSVRKNEEDIKQYFNYYNFVAATYSFEILSDDKKNTPAYSEPNDNNTTDIPRYKDYPLWIKNSYYRLMSKDSQIAKDEQYVMLIINDGLFKGPIQISPWFDTSSDSIPTKMSQLQFNFLDKYCTNVNLFEDDDMWFIEDNDTKIPTSTRKASELFHHVELDDSEKDNLLDQWHDDYINNYVFKNSDSSGNSLYYFVLHVEPYEAGVITDRTYYNNWNNYTYNYRDLIGQNIYNLTTHQKVDIIAQENLFQLEFDNQPVEFLVQDTENTYFRLATLDDFNATDSKFYYYKNNNYYPTYTLEQLLKDPQPLVMFEGSNLLVTNFVLDSQRFDVNFYLHKQKRTSEGIITTSTQFAKQFLLDFTDAEEIEYRNSICKCVSLSIPFNDNIYTGRILLQSGTSKEILHKMTNGEFWYRFHNKSEWPVILEQCAALEAELSLFWSGAYSASLYCNHFLPESWIPPAENRHNYFASEVWDLRYNDKQELQKVALKSTFIPKVSIYQQQDAEGIWQTNLPAYKLEYKADFDMKLDYTSAKSVLENNPAYQQTLEVLLPMEQWANWSAVENGKRTYYYIDSKENHGMTWAEFVGQYTTQSTMYNLYNGLYALQFYILFNYYTDSSNIVYETLQEKKLASWQYLNLLYPNILLEGTYTNKQATTSEELYRLAQLAFKDQSQPEKQYNITILDVNRIAGDHKFFRIGEPIAINAQEYYDEPDDIFFALSQFLFITDISYNLRSDADISLTVNSIKYQEKLLQQLVKLIR